MEAIQLPEGFRPLVKKCLCRCIRPFPPYGRPINRPFPPYGIIPAVKDVRIPLRKSHVSVNILNSMAEITYSQEYFNEENNPVEIKYNFPSDYEYAVTQIAAKIDDKEIKTEIMEKKEAAEKYDDAIASGNTGIMAKIDEKLPDVIDLAIGQLQPGKTVLIELKIVTQLKAVSKRFYNFVFPMHFIPKYGGSSVKV